MPESKYSPSAELPPVLADKLTVTVPAPLAKVEAEAKADVHAVLAKLEAELLGLPDYVVTRLKASIAELRATL